MMICARYILALYLLISSVPTTWANAIDSLSGKRDVQNFLVNHFSNTGITHLTMTDISSLDKNHPPFVFDTPYPLDSLEATMKRTSWQFYKADINSDGHTDLVVDAGIVVIVVDTGNGFEAHTFSTSPVWNSYSFTRFFLLPDGTPALLLRHDHNPYRSVEHAGLHGKVAYITDTIAVNGATTSYVRVDTLYKITTGRERLWPIPSQGNPRDTATIPYADTVDLRLYNMTDTIISINNGFTIYKSGLAPADISRIHYYCYLSGGITGNFDACLEINKHGKSFYQHAGEPPVFSGMLDSATTNMLWRFMRHVDFISKKDNYFSETDHSSGCVFTIYFDNGTTKTINFWAYDLPIDLAYLGKMLYNAGRTVNWQPCGKHEGFNCPR